MRSALVAVSGHRLMSPFAGLSLGICAFTAVSGTLRALGLLIVTSELAMTSAYRSYDQQWAIYEDRAAEYGTESTDEAMARPGHSEHQTGLAADVISIDNPECEACQ